MNHDEARYIASAIVAELAEYKPRDDAFSKRKVEAIGQRLKEVEVLVDELLSDEDVEDYVELDL